MELKTKYLLGGTGFGVALTAILLFTLISFLPTPINNVTTVTVAEANKPSGHVIAKVWRNGELIYTYETHNIIVTIGSTWVKDFLKDGTAGATNPTDDIAIGTHGTPTASDTKLDSEQTDSSLIRTSVTPTNINATAYNVTNTWISDITATVNATSLHHDPTSDSDNNAVAIASIAEANLIANDEIEIIWILNCPAGS